MLALQLWLCAHLCCAEIELVSAIIPLLWQAASAFIVCSNVKLIRDLENGLFVHLIGKRPFLKS